MNVQPHLPRDEAAGGEAAGDGRPDPGDPQGIGMAVAFDWGLVVQILATPFLPLLFGGEGIFKAWKLSPALTTLVTLVLFLPFAALIAIFGEGVRRGWRCTRPVQLIFNVLLFLGGIALLPNLWRSVRAGNYWPLVTEVITRA